MSPRLSRSFSRAAASRAPKEVGSPPAAGAASARTSSSVIEITPCEHRHLGRAREPLPQLVGQLALGAQIPIGAGDAQAEPERLGRRLDRTGQQVVVEGGAVDLA